jgi:hypothetical protein
MEPGEEPFFLLPSNLAIEVRGSQLTLSCWSDTRNLSRRIRSVKSVRTGRVELEYERFGGKSATLWLVDMAHPSNRTASRTGTRHKYRELFRMALCRQFVGWKLVELSVEQDLGHSLSPSYPRALLRRGLTAWAAIGAGEDATNPDGALSFGLIWLDYLRRREKRLSVQGLAVFLPIGLEPATCHRIRQLDRRKADYRVFVQHPDGLEDAADPRDYTNLHTRLSPCAPPLRLPPAWTAALEAIDGVDIREHPDGSVRCSVRGLEFARSTAEGPVYGLDSNVKASSGEHLREMGNLARGLAELRGFQSPDRGNPLYVRNPEAWFESQVRSSIREIDAGLSAHPVYGQVPQFAGEQHGLMDLLAIDDTGRLAVLELKTSQDIHLPLQALDYWMRVTWHLAQKDFSRAGYFPGNPPLPDPPKLYLVAPALEFHPTNEILLRYFAPEIEVERVGVGLEWRKELKVMFRRGNRPGSEGNEWLSQSLGS